MVFIGNLQSPSPAAQAATTRCQAAATRFAGQVEVSLAELSDPAALDRGISLEPAVLVGELLVAVGQAPPAGHLVRAIEAALARERGFNA
jgi:hypothetical protein